MLPSTKLFKNIICPFYDDNGECTRPYCHYKHAKTEEKSEFEQGTNVTSTIDSITQEIQLLPPPVPVYVPTPKHILEARKENGTTAIANAPIALQAPAKKRPKLEYVPRPKHPVEDASTAPTYVPSTLPSPSDEYVPSKDSNETDDLMGIENELISTSEEIQSNKKSVELSQEMAPLNNAENSSRTNVVKESKQSDSKEKSSSRRGSSSKSSHSSSHRSDRHKHSSSKSSHRSSSSSHKKSSSSSSYTSSHSSRNKSKYSDKNRSTSKESKVKNGYNKSTSSSSSQHRSSSHKHSSHRSNSSDPKSKSASASETQEEINLNALIYESDMEEDDVEAQCRMIFEEFDPETVTQASDSETMTSTNETHDPMAKYDDCGKRKRVAYENADTHPKPLKSHQSTNHVQNALQSVFRRQEIVRKQMEAKEQKEQEELAKCQAAQIEIKRNSIEQQQRSKSSTADSTAKLTPLVSATPLSHQRYYAKTFAPVSNVLALLKAKEKVDQLRAAKQQQQKQQYSPKTLAQTAAKGASRVAHTSAAPVQNSPTKPAPPVLEASSTKISYNIRMQYYNMMVKHCLTIYDQCTDAWERAQTEELAVFKKCSAPVTYKSSALLAINRLRKESLDAGNVNTEKGKVISHDVILAGKLGQQVSWSVNKKPLVEVSGSTNIVDTIASSKAYELIAELCLTEDQLKNNGYPRAGAKPGMASIFTSQKAAPNNENDRYCRRCGKTFTLDHYDEDCVDQCNYHNKSPGFRRGFADHAHRCCQLPAGSPGCMYANYHVTDYLDYKNLTGFVKTIECDDHYVPSRKDVFALDCEMCYTIIGLELTRITVVDINRKTVYDALVKPSNRIVDYNTTYSGITEKTLENVTRTLRDVQAVLLSMFNSKTILVGHSLESDFKALKLIHDRVVDTSVLYPHRMGPPMKRALKTLCIENLKRIIQEDEGGHNSAEDAEVCIELIKHYLRNRTV